MALARLDIPSVMLYGGSIAPGRWRGKDVTILDVFEAIGAHAAGNMSDEDLLELEDVREPRRRRLRRPVHRQHDGLRVRGDGDLARWARRWSRRRTARRREVADEVGELAVKVLAEDLRPSKIITARVDRERDRLRLRVGRLDERRAPPARGRARGGDRAGHRRLRADLARAPRCSPT